MMRWLVLRLRAPMASFGGAAIDAHGVTRDFPAASALTGLLGAALGYDRADAAALDALQARLVLGARRENDPVLGRLTDFQTAKLGANDQGWTTRGAPEGRAGGGPTYDSPHIRWRDHHADSVVTVVLRLDPADATPTLDDLAAALDRPEWPLFVGRKACPPSDRINGGFTEAATARDALIGLARVVPGEGTLRALWPSAEGAEGADRVAALCDQRDWRSGLHGGERGVAEGRITPAALP
jgi:CRISPR system Cascade subunit CasD